MMKRPRLLDMSDEHFEDFLRRLANDEDFRRAMMRDPAATLTGAGFRARPEQMPERVTLPSREELEAKIGYYLERKQQGRALHVPFGLIGGDCALDDDYEMAKEQERSTPMFSASNVSTDGQAVTH